MQMTDSDAPPHTQACLKREGRRASFLVHPPGSPPHTLKRWPLTPAMALKLALGIAQPQRLVRGARRLDRVGIPTARPVSPWRIVRRPTGWTIEVELEYLPGRSALKWLQDDSLTPAQRRQTARRLGKLVANLAQAGVLHRDCKPSNVIINQTEVESDVALIDTVAIRTGVPPALAVADMLAHLAYIPPCFMPFLTPDLIKAVLRAALRRLPPQSRREALRRLRQARQ